MAETNDSDLPIQGKLITQKVTKNELQIEIIINDIRKCDSGNDEIEELRRKARKALQGVSSDIQALVDLIEQENTTCRKGSLESEIAKHKNRMLGLQVSLRKASLLAAEKMSSLERDQLLSPNTKKEKSEDGVIQRRRKNQEKATKVTKNITSNLVKIAEMMNSQVEHGMESTRVLEESSKQLVETQEELKGMAGVIQMSKKLINKYSRRELTDTLLILFGLVLFFSTVTYIVLKRI